MIGIFCSTKNVWNKNGDVPTCHIMPYYSSELLMAEIPHRLRLVVYPPLFSVWDKWINPRWLAGFLPSTVFCPFFWWVFQDVGIHHRMSMFQPAIFSLESNQPAFSLWISISQAVSCCFHQVVSLVFYVAIRDASVVGGLAFQCLGHFWRKHEGNPMMAGWWFQIVLIFIPKVEEMIQLNYHFSDGLHHQL